MPKPETCCVPTAALTSTSFLSTWSSYVTAKRGVNLRHGPHHCREEAVQRVRKECSARESAGRQESCHAEQLRSREGGA